jgi:hypothetical protein
MIQSEKEMFAWYKEHRDTIVQVFLNEHQDEYDDFVVRFWEKHGKEKPKPVRRFT